MTDVITLELVSLGIDAERWLSTPLRVLNDKTPQQLIEEGQGGIVLEMLKSLNSGVLL